MSQRVTTAHGPGVIVAQETIRGRTSYQVQGDQFCVWLEANSIPEFGFLNWDENPHELQDNSTTLPYNPEPQFYPHSGESTIQPNQHLDTDKRLTPADSVSYQERAVDSRARMDHLFAARSSSSRIASWREEYDGTWYNNYDNGLTSQIINQSDSGEDDLWLGTLESPDGSTVLDTRGSLDDVRSAIDRAAEGQTAASRIAAEPSDAGTHEDIFYPSPVTDEEYPGGTNVPEDHAVPEGFALGSIADTQARLGDKYIDIPLDIDRSSLQARLDDDPVRVVSDIKMRNFEVRKTLDPRIGQALDLEEADSNIRTSAWADVRAKATRIRASGGVQLEAANPTAIVATVTGDHGIYEVAVLRGSALTGNSSVSEWSCSCPWGDWAFEREHTYVGRLCSHAYAALQELRSLTMRSEKPRDWSHKAKTAQYPRQDQIDQLNDDSSQRQWESEPGFATQYSDLSEDELFDQVGRAQPGTTAYSDLMAEFSQRGLMDTWNYLTSNRGVAHRTATDWYQLGQEAYANGVNSSPTADPQVQSAIKDLPVGGGAADIMREWSKGWQAANLSDDSWNKDASRKQAFGPKDQGLDDFLRENDEGDYETVPGNFGYEKPVREMDLDELLDKYDHDASRKQADLDLTGYGTDESEEVDLGNGCYGLLRYTGDSSGGTGPWSCVIYNPDGEMLDTAYGFDQDHAVREAKDLVDFEYSTGKYGARHPSPDGELATKPGTLTPDLMYVPKTHERRRLDVTDDRNTGNWRTYNKTAAGYGEGYDQQADDAVIREFVQWANQNQFEPTDPNSLEVYNDAGGGSNAIEQDEYDLIADWQENDGDDRKYAFLSGPFEGSGSDQPDGYESSETYVDSHELRHRQSIDGPEGNPAVRNDSDVVAHVREGSLDYLMDGSDSSGAGEIADAAASFLQRTAGRNFSLAEQQALMDEEAVGGPIEASDFDLRGTHYL